MPKPVASSQVLSFLYVAYIMLWIFAGLVWMSVFLNRISSKTERIVDTHVELGVRISHLESNGVSNGGVVGDRSLESRSMENMGGFSPNQSIAHSNRDDDSILPNNRKSRPLFPKNVIKKEKRSASILFY